MTRLAAVQDLMDAGATQADRRGDGANGRAAGMSLADGGVAVKRRLSRLSSGLADGCEIHLGLVSVPKGLGRMQPASRTMRPDCLPVDLALTDGACMHLVLHGVPFGRCVHV